MPILAFAAAIAAPAHAERWVGYAYSDYGPSGKIILRGPTWFGGDGTVGFAGRFRCFSSTCLARRGLSYVAWWNHAYGFAWQADGGGPAGRQQVHVARPVRHALYTLPPSIGTEIIVRYECEDASGYVLDSGSVDVTRRR